MCHVKLVNLFDLYTRKLVNDALSVELSSESMYNASIVRKMKIRLLTISG